MSPQHVQRIEYGENMMISTLVKLANTFDVPIRELFRKPTTSKPKPGRPRTGTPRKR